MNASWCELPSLEGARVRVGCRAVSLALRTRPDSELPINCADGAGATAGQRQRASLFPVTRMFALIRPQNGATSRGTEL